jgi:glycosyltransferase involved in cell wall biosynthesis
MVVNHHPNEALGGSEVQCDLIARGLSARGHEVTYVAIRPLTVSDDSPSLLEGLPYPVVRSMMEPGAILDVLLAGRPDVVYWRFNRRGLRQVARGLRAAGIPLTVALAHVDDVTPWPTWPWPPSGATLRERLADVSGRVRWRSQLTAFADVTAIASQREDLLDRAPVALQAHVPNIMDPRVEPFVWPRPFVAWVGNLKPRKRPELIPAIADALIAHGVDLVVVGPSVDARVAESLAGQRRANLHQLGPIAPAQVSGLLEEARCLAVTARPEGFSNVMIQAWWGATPTVTLDYDPDGLVASEGLGSVAGGDLDVFLADVVRFATSPDDAEAAGGRAQSLARERFAPSVGLDRLEALLTDASRAERSSGRG